MIHFIHNIINTKQYKHKQNITSLNTTYQVRYNAIRQDIIENGTPCVFYYSYFIFK